MANLRSFSVEFNRPAAIYTPGDIVEGNVIIDLANEKTVRALKLQAKGKAFVRWSESRSTRNSGGRSSSSSTTYQGKENYFDFTYPMLESTGDDKKVQLPAGLSKFPFRIQLPNNIPCSFEHLHGHIRYTIKAIIDRPWRFDHECKAAFTVITAYDLNVYPDQCLGTNDEVNKTFGCFCFDRGFINVHIRIPTTGFVPGQSIEAILSFKNNSSLDLTKFRAKLVRFTELFAQTFGGSSKKKTDKSTVTTVENTGPFSENGVIVLQLNIPAVPPSELKFCGIINLKYALHITLCVSSRMHRNIRSKHPILIGTIPLRSVTSTSAISPYLPTIPESASKFEDISSPSKSDVAPSAPYPDSPSTNNFLDTPTSYEECKITKTESIEDNDDSGYIQGTQVPFAPKYPFFNFSTSHAAV